MGKHGTLYTRGGQGVGVGEGVSSVKRSNLEPLTPGMAESIQCLREVTQNPELQRRLCRPGALEEQVKEP
jgi:hypothetical protein